MKKLLKFAHLSALVIVLFSCKKKDEQRCVMVKYLSNYCPKPGAALVQVQSRSSEGLVLLNIPERYRVKDKVFYVTYHYDPALDYFDDVICPQNIYIYDKMYTADSVGEENCDK